METVPARGLRRERNEGDDELEIMAPPAKKPATIVDLTDDGIRRVCTGWLIEADSVRA